LPLFVFSCTEKQEFITLSDTSVTILYDGSKQLTVNYSSDALKSKTYNYSSSDSTIVSVSKTGLVSGVSIGTATVKVSSSDGKYTDDCNFTVSSKSTLYKEPYTVFGSTILTVKSKEARTLSKETATALLYTDTDPNVRYVMYLFESGKSTSTAVLLTQTTSIATEVPTFLFERYKYLGASGGYYIYKDRKSGIGVALTVDATLGLCVIYTTPTSSSSVQIQKLKKSNQTSTTNGSNEALSSELQKIMSQKTH
ncbi:MAG TPA: Ig-like domain-containing protein, partial [Paludibacter sp.]|nr:Ig-like domain-containing protein [Paludibacter sp.]